MPFGWTQLKKETPRIIKSLRDTVIYTVAGSLPFAELLANKWGITVNDYAMYSGLIILLSKSISMLFGVKDEGSEGIVSNSVGPGGSQNPPPSGLPPKP